MNIDALGIHGIQHLNSAHIPFSSAAMPPAQGLNTRNEFEELLRRTQSARTVGSTPSSPASRLPTTVQNEKLYELCLELETFLVKNLIKSMRSTVQKTNLIDTGLAGEIYEDMLFDEYAKVLTRNAGFGFAEMAYRELAGFR